MRRARRTKMPFFLSLSLLHLLRRFSSPRRQGVSLFLQGPINPAAAGLRKLRDERLRERVARGVRAGHCDGMSGIDGPNMSRCYQGTDTRAASSRSMHACIYVLPKFRTSVLSLSPACFTLPRGDNIFYTLELAAAEAILTRVLIPLVILHARLLFFDRKHDFGEIGTFLQKLFSSTRTEKMRLIYI